VKVVEIGRDRSLAIADRPQPDLGPDEVRVAVSFCGVCGSDLHMRADAGFPAGAVLGHELSGRVAELGSRVQGWALGDRVAVLIYRNCGTCRYCLAGSENHCVVGGHLGHVLGVQQQGGLAESVVATPNQLFKVPPDLADDEAALTEPVAVALRASRSVDCALDDPVAVVGAGPIGLLVAHILKYRGFSNVVVVELHEHRRLVAEEMGLATLGADEDQLRKIEPAVVVDASGSPAAIRMAIRALRSQGQLVLVGLPAAEVPIDINYLILHEIRISPSAGYGRRDFGEALELLADGAIPTASIITSRVALDEAEHGFDELKDPHTRHVKILLHP
jgi:(R,R)-butanediol dehydrogenase / meso-butanediol dehydrogenase / diacetyl reductase